MNEEKKKILEMLESGKISAQEAAELLEAVGEEKENKELLDTSKLSEEYAKKYLRVRVYDQNDDTKVKINIPIKLVKAGLSIAKNFGADLEGVNLSDRDIDMIIEAIENEVEGEIVNIEADEGKTIVKVYID
ncbi:MAG: SHOCT-like domain-containing protein [Fusobacteriota bacterium]